MRRNRITKVVTVDSRLSVWLQAIKARTGISEAEQMRRGIQLWVESFQGFVGERDFFASAPTPVEDDMVGVSGTKTAASRLRGGRLRA